MYYFGLLFEMNLKSIKLRLEFLKEFLNLPDTKQLCETLRFVHVYMYVLVFVLYVCVGCCLKEN